jgi:SIR2-like protein
MALSSTILSSPILLLLGAGASAPLGKLLMDSFVTKLTTEVREDNPRRMLGFLSEFRGTDLEAIMGELETLIGMEYASSVEGTRQVKSPSGTNSFAFSLDRATATRLRWLIKHAVIRQYRNIETGQAVELYDPLLDRIFTRIDPAKQCLVIFTTNYDPAIEVFCQAKFANYNLCDGFAHNPADRHYYWHRSVFDNFQLDPSKRNIVLFKIHGPVDWLYVKSTNKIRRGQAMYDAVDSDAYSNVLIYPATRKIATNDPFYSGCEYYQRSCEAAKVCLAIGYSFRDYDALTRLRGASSMNDRLELALVSPDADKILADVPIPDTKKLAFPYYFGKAEQANELLAGVETMLNQSI